MGEFSPIHWLIGLEFLGGIVIRIPWLAYRHGRKVGDHVVICSWRMNDMKNDMTEAELYELCERVLLYRASGSK